MRSHEAGKWLCPEPYLAWKAAKAPGRQLRGMSIFVAAGEKLDKARTCALVEAAGGTIVPSMSRASHVMGASLAAMPEGLKPLSEAALIELVLKPPSADVEDEAADDSEAESEEF